MPTPVPGDFLPTFYANSSVNSHFAFASLGGYQFLLAFVGTLRSEPGRALAEAALADADWLTQKQIQVFIVTLDPQGLDDPLLSRLVERFVVFWDHDRAISRLYGMEVSPPSESTGTSILRIGTYLFRRNLRLHAMIGATPMPSFSERLRGAVETLPRSEPGRMISQQAPVLLVPDVLSPSDCRRFIDYYEQIGGTASGFMRDVNGRTRGIIDPKLKRRKDVYINDPQLQGCLRSALLRRVLPEIERAYAFRVTRVERYMIGCYDGTDRGFFGAHRDNETKATAHRIFAMSLNLNSDEYDGGALRFPAYGTDVYKPETGSAVVFSCSLLHEALPVTRGRRYAILPFMYDDAAAAKRQETRQFLEDGPPTEAGRETAA